MGFFAAQHKTILFFFHLSSIFRVLNAFFFNLKNSSVEISLRINKYKSQHREKNEDNEAFECIFYIFGKEMPFLSFSFQIFLF